MPLPRSHIWFLFVATVPSVATRGFSPGGIPELSAIRQKPPLLRITAIGVYLWKLMRLQSMGQIIRPVTRFRDSVVKREILVLHPILKNFRAN